MFKDSVIPVIDSSNPCRIMKVGDNSEFGQDLSKAVGLKRNTGRAQSMDWGPVVS